MTAPLPAHDIGAEQALLGAVIAAPTAASTAFAAVPVDAFWHERHRTIATVVHDRLRRELPVDPQLVLQGVLGKHGIGDDIGPYIHTLYERAWMPANAGFYAERVRALHAARRLSEVCQRGLQRLGEATSRGDDMDLESITGELATSLDEVRGLTVPAELPDPPTVLDLLDEHEVYNWLVPGLMERGERLLLTGSEGLGKSVLITMLAACFAGGVHPFTRRPITPLRVAVVDCENPRQLARRRYRDMLPRVAALRDEMCITPPDWKQLFIEFRPEGLNLLQSRDVAWLDAWCRSTAPDVLVLGPIYKLHATNINDETAARELTRVLDMIRTRYGCALISEAHAGNAEDSTGRRVMRPIGSSLFRRWPEFGFGMVRAKDVEPSEHPDTVDMVAWRGSREERDWPRHLQHGQTLPWVPHGEYQPARHLEIA